MAVSLLELSGGGVSLEFDEPDLAKIRAAIATQFGEILVLANGPLLSEVEFGGERFVYYQEWTPCLLSRSEKGASILRLIAAMLSAGPADCP